MDADLILVSGYIPPAKQKTTEDNRMALFYWPGISFRQETADVNLVTIKKVKK
jgi:methylmalonyl-CoA mutase cobalamin-binding subunit